MDGVTTWEAFVGLLLSSGITWGAMFALAYCRRQFAQPARGYIGGFLATWVLTVIIFTLATVWENR
jgi:hypothetical protein